MMRKLTILLLLFISAAGFSLTNFGLAEVVSSKKKVLYVDSYHEGYPWSTGITEGIMKILNIEINNSGDLDNSRSRVDLKIIRMDTKRNASEQFKIKAALKVKDEIESWQPDVVIASDDNASKYLIKPYFKNKELPFVFCGVNWDASVYGFPYKNVTGMIEISFISPLINAMKQYAKGARIGILAADNLSNRKEAIHYKNKLNIDLTEEVFVKDLDQWKREYAGLQKKVDMLILAPPSFLKDDSGRKEAAMYVQKNTNIPTGSVEDWIAPYSLFVYSKISNEQGEWAASTALEILDGKSPEDIPIATNKKAKIFLNASIAKNLGIIFPKKMMRRATFVN